MTRPETRTARRAESRSVTGRAIRTWNSITAPVLSTNSADTSQPGALVRSTIHSGIARLSSGIRRSRTAFSRVTSAYGRSRNTASRGSPASRCGTGATGGSESSTAAQTRKLTVSRARAAW